MDSPQSNTARIINILAIIGLLAASVTIGMIWMGIFDPKPFGSLSERLPLNVDVTVYKDYLHWIDPKPDNDTFTIRLEAKRIRGEEDLGYGLALGDQTRYLIVAVSPTGYATIDDIQSVNAPIVDAGSNERSNREIFPWQTWPHVGKGDRVNEIWLDVERGKLVSIRLNRELLWEGLIPLADTNIGLWAETYGQPGAVAFQQLEIFH